MLPRYRFPGKQDAPAYCDIIPECKPFTIIKACPPKPFVRDVACRGNVYDRGIIRMTPPDKMCEIKAKFVIETFHRNNGNNLILYPLNLDIFCGYTNAFKDGAIVAVEAQDESKSCTSPIPCALPVKLFGIKRVWKWEIRSGRGSVHHAVDSNGITYYKLVETYDPTAGDPLMPLTENSLKLRSTTIDYEIYNIMDVCNLEQTLAGLVGRTIIVTYLDYGKETPERRGIPIVITEYTVV
jgi:hypothetical protein